MAVALKQRAMADDILIGDTPKAKRRRKRLDKLRAKGRLWKHSTLADIDGVLSASELEPYFIFTPQSLGPFGQLLFLAALSRL